MAFGSTVISSMPEYFKVRTLQGKLYLLRYDERADEWTLQSGFDGDELLALCKCAVSSEPFDAESVLNSPPVSRLPFTPLSDEKGKKAQLAVQIR
jgi:hypothetical protein